MTTLVVVVTANHFWLDGMVAVVILALALAAQALARRLVATERDRRRNAPSAAEPRRRTAGYSRSSLMMIPASSPGPARQSRADPS